MIKAHHSNLISCGLLVRHLILLIALFLGPLGFSQTDPEASELVDAVEDKAIPEQFNSPQATWRTFYRSIKNDEWPEAVKCLNLSKVSSQQAVDLAKKLNGSIGKTGLINDGLLPDMAAIKKNNLSTYLIFPKAGNSRHQTLRDRYTDIPSIVMSPNAEGLWLFSADTVASIPKLTDLLRHEQQIAGKQIKTRDQQFEALFPESMQVSLLGLKYWQWLGLLIFILIGLVIDHLVRFIVRYATLRVMKRFGRSVDSTTLIGSAKATGLLVMALFWLFLINTLGFQGIVFQIMHGAASIFATLIAMIATWRFSDIVSDVVSAFTSKTETNVDDVLLPLANKAIKIFIVIFGLIYGAMSLDFNVVPLLGALGIGGVGFAFAAKDTLENFFGSATVLIDQPFTVGDWVLVNDVEGTVEAIGFRSTRVRTFYNSLITIPNANLVRATVDNFGSRKYRRYKTTLGIQYDTPHEMILAFTAGLRELVRKHPYTRKDYYHIYFHGYGPSSLDILLYCFFEAPDWAVELRERERLNMDILRLADKLGIQFAFPTQTVHLYQESQNAAHVPAPAPEETTDQKAGNIGASAAEQIMQHQPWQIEKPGLVDYGASPPVEPLINRNDSGNEEAGEQSQIEQRGAGG